LSPEVLITLIGVAGALISVAGTLVGTFGSAVLTNRFAREREQRDTEERRRQETLALCEVLASNALLLRDRHQLDDQTLTTNVTRIQLQTSPETSEAANELYNACRKAAQVYRASPTDFHEIDRVLEEVNSARAHFLNVARNESESTTDK
jgi:hypothetical protein